MTSLCEAHNNTHFLCCLGFQSVWKRWNDQHTDLFYGLFMTLAYTYTVYIYGEIIVIILVLFEVKLR